MPALTWLDWSVVAAYCLLALGIGVALSRRATRDMDEYFVAGRTLPWWIAGTSMVATSFAADTPL
ncbi:MAG: sodium:proline symporter, partial [Kiritimatiellae bacterium]|nr:sodium:proline symporter [Kiritimatiellia bacterium]